MSLKVSISGIRGHVPGSLTPEVVLDFSKAFGTYLRQKKRKKHLSKVIIGTDPRASSEYIKGIVVSGLISTGCNVIDLGIAPTPTIGIMTRKLAADGGIIITASHNPLPWNGIKFVREDGIFLNQAQAESLIQIYESKAFYKDFRGTAKTCDKALTYHINTILKVIKPPKIQLRVAIDCVNGAGSVYCVKLLKRLGAKVIPINCDTTRPFAHDPEPIETNLGGLMKIVTEKKADIGFALDSDADRLAIVSDQGKAIGEELTLCLATKYILQKSRSNKKTIVTNLSTTQALDDICQEAGAKLIRTKIGEVHVAEEIKRTKAMIGGEGNGGVILPSIGFNRDALAGITLVLAYLMQSKKSISSLAKEIPDYYALKTKKDCSSQAEADKFIENTKIKFKGYEQVLTDGIKVLLLDGWVHVRASNTEPVIRIIAEAKTRPSAQALIDQVLS